MIKNKSNSLNENLFKLKQQNSVLCVVQGFLNACIRKDNGQADIPCDQVRGTKKKEKKGEREVGVRHTTLPSCVQSGGSWSAHVHMQFHSREAGPPAHGQTVPLPHAKVHWPWWGCWLHSHHSRSRPEGRTASGIVSYEPVSGGQLAVVTFHYHLDWTWHHLGDKPLGTSVRMSPERIKWSETHTECGCTINGIESWTE